MPALPGIPKRFWAGGLIGVALTLCGGPSLPAGGPGKADDETIAGLIRQLGDPQFKARERAAAELLKLGKAALAQLQQAARAGTDPEIRRRAQGILGRLDQEIRRASGVHMVGLYEAASNQHFRLVAPFGRGTDWSRFGAALAEQGKDDAPSPGKRLWELLPPNVRAIAADRDMVKRINALVQGPGAPREDVEARRGLNLFAQALEQALRRPDFYQGKAFAGVRLDEEGEQLRKRHGELSLLEAWVLNRRLLEASFPGTFKEDTFRLARATVPVRVVPTREPVTLVLCSYESVRWQVLADPGARIARVIVGGYHLQDVTGTDAPVTYRVYERPGRAEGEPRYFYAYRRDDESYRRLEDAVRRLTDKEVSTFQGRYAYAGGPPFVVGKE